VGAELERVTQPTLDVLEVLLAADDFELHGWAVIRATGRAGPTVYKVLERLTEIGWVTRRWEDQPADANRPRRRFYRLTPDGLERARAVLSERRAHRAPNWQPRFGGAV